jgi:NADH:ubiquinone oxidoreductase subunit H
MRSFFSSEKSRPMSLPASATVSRVMALVAVFAFAMVLVLVWARRLEAEATARSAARSVERMGVIVRQSRVIRQIR